jgi:DnaK suppressor protein
VPKSPAASKSKRRKTASSDEKFRAKLLAARDEILSQYERDVRQGQESAEEASQDIVDRATSSYNREFMFSLSGNERETLIQIERALERLGDGTYYDCDNCGQPIARKRLEAVPWTHYCIDCQELKEQGLLEEE